MNNTILLYKKRVSRVFWTLVIIVLPLDLAEWAIGVVDSLL
jgi:hypothetical protein